jgi:hypothetical protein
MTSFMDSGVVWYSDLGRNLKAEVRHMTREERKAFFDRRAGVGMLSEHADPSRWTWLNVWLPSWKKERTRILTPTYMPIMQPDGSTR